MTYILVTFELYGAERLAYSDFDIAELEEMMERWFDARKAEVNIEPDPDIDDSEEADE